MNSVSKPVAISKKTLLELVIAGRFAVSVDEMEGNVHDCEVVQHYDVNLGPTETKPHFCHYVEYFGRHEVMAMLKELVPRREAQRVAEWRQLAAGLSNVAWNGMWRNYRWRFQLERMCRDWETATGAAAASEPAPSEPDLGESDDKPKSFWVLDDCGKWEECDIRTVAAAAKCADTAAAAAKRADTAAAKPATTAATTAAAGGMEPLPDFVEYDLEPPSECALGAELMKPIAAAANTTVVNIQDEWFCLPVATVVTACPLSATVEAPAAATAAATAAAAVEAEADEATAAVEAEADDYLVTVEALNKLIQRVDMCERVIPKIIKLMKPAGTAPVADVIELYAELATLCREQRAALFRK